MDTINDIRVIPGLKMSRKGDAITLSISPEEKEALEKIAEELGEKWGDKPNISQLMRAIANKKYQILPSRSPEAEYINKLREAISQAESSLRKLKKTI